MNCLQCALRKVISVNQILRRNSIVNKFLTYSVPLKRNYYRFVVSSRLKKSYDFSIRTKHNYALLAGLLTWLGLKKEEEDPVVSVIKQAVLNLQREEFDKAEVILHLALKLAQERQDMQAQRYIFDLLANVAFEKGDFPKAETLFLQVMKELLSSGTSPDANSVVEISLKLASIYGQQNLNEKADTGFQFCIDTQKKKLEGVDTSNIESLSETELDTLVLLAMSMDWYAAHLFSKGRLKSAKEHYTKALEISEKVKGSTHPHTIDLMNDLGNVQCFMKEYDSAIKTFEDAIQRSADIDLPEISALYCNLGAAYLEKGNVDKGEGACKTALKLAKKMKNEAIQVDAEECLKEVEHMRVH